MSTHIYDCIKDLCSERKITIKDVEIACGFSNGSISKWRGTYSPGIDKVQKVADFFGVSIDFLIGRSKVSDLADEIIDDEDIISIQRSRTKLGTQESKRRMKLIRDFFEI